MASLVSSENWAVGDYELQGIEVSGELTAGILTSLMEELQDQVEEGDEERLNRVIQSLEAEMMIGSNTSDADSQPDRRSDGQDRLVSPDDLEMDGWINDMESTPAMPCSPRHDMNPYMYQTEDRDIIGFEGVSTDYLGVALDLDQYGSLWNETVYDSVMYE